MSWEKEIRGSLLTIGDEILHGDIPNGNAHHIASELRAGGFRLQRIFTVGDREDEIASVLLQCLSDSQFVIVSGGLGPTDDDRTNAGVSRALGIPLVHDEAYLDRLRGRLVERGRPWTQEVAKLTEMPRGAVKTGRDMAGYFLEHEKVPCYFLPGVPYEMRHLMARFVLPDLQKRFPWKPAYVKRVLRFQSVFESEIGHRIKQVDLEQWGVEVGYYPQVREVWVTLLAFGQDVRDVGMRVDEAERKVLEKLGRENFSGYKDDSMEKVVGDRLIDKGWAMAVAESCTGGLVAERITSIAGASAYFDRGFVTYSNEAKTALLGVPVDLLDKYGAVSEPVAEAMARGAQERAGVDVSLAVTGIAGPTGGSAEKPVGTVYMACVVPGGAQTIKHRFRGDRDTIRRYAAQAALELLWRSLCP